MDTRDKMIQRYYSLKNEAQKTTLDRGRYELEVRASEVRHLLQECYGVEVALIQLGESTFDNTVTTIDAWYDRHTKDYCIQLLNKDGYQVGNAYRVGTKADKDSMVNDLKQEYNL